MNLIDGATFLTPLIKCAKTRINKKIKFPHDPKRRIWEIAINNGWNTQIFPIWCEMRNVNFLFKGNLFRRIPKPAELTYKCIKKKIKYQEPEFYYRFFDDSEKGLFELPPGRTYKYIR